MAFGFFKKTITADTIFHNGHIFTQDGSSTLATLKI